MAFEFQILDFLQRLHTPLFNDILLFFTKCGDAGILWILIAILLLSRKQTRRIGIIMCISLVINYVICNQILKELFARTRPYEIRQPLEMILEKQSDFSFPSGHTSVSFTAVTVFFLAEKTHRRIWKIALIIASCIAFSRMYFYVHFPTDILGGIFVGIVAGISGYSLVEYFEKRGILFRSKESK